MPVPQKHLLKFAGNSRKNFHCFGLYSPAYGATSVESCRTARLIPIPKICKLFFFTLFYDQGEMLMLRTFCFISATCVALSTTMTISSFAGSPGTAKAGQFSPPATKKIPVTETLHGRQLSDEYRWLEDKSNSEVVAWTKAQHEAAVSYINANTVPIPGLEEEFRTYIDRDIIGAPFFHGRREFFTARKKGEPQSKLYTRIDGKEILIFDPVAIDPSGKTAMTGQVFTQDGNKAAIGYQSKGSEISSYRIIDTRTGKQIGSDLVNIWGFSWTKDEQHAYITPRTKEMIDNQLPLKTYVHKLGDDHAKDVFITGADDAKNSAWVMDTEDGDVTIFGNGDFYSNTLRFRKIGSTAEPVTVYSSTEYRADPYVRGNRAYFYTNHGAPNFKLMVADVDKPQFEHWRTLIPESETVLENYAITSDYLIVQDKKDVMSRLKVYDLDGKFIKNLELPEFGNVSGLDYNKEMNVVFTSLTTFTSPAKLYKLDGKTLKWEFYYQDKPPIDTKNIEGQIVFYPSKDGTKIPMFIIHRKDMKLDGTNPTLLTGYGGFNIGISPSYVGLGAAFINRGGVVAIAGIRGGDEYGESWHQDGMLKNKQHTFDDFIAASEYLVREKYTKHEKIAIKGGSNGGLLIGAVLTQRPDICGSAICAVPLLDMVRYHKFLIARYWIPEYGDPEVKEDFDYIMTYSPYQNIRKGVNLPPTLVIPGENDTRVDPLHAKKFVAALQNNEGQKDPVMLYVHYDGGHGPGKPISLIIEENLVEWRFMMNELGMTQKP